MGEVNAGVQVLLPHAQPQKVPRWHITLDRLLEDVVQRLITVCDDERALAWKVVVQ